MPAATGIRFSISTRSGGAAHPAVRKPASASLTRLGPRTPAQTTRSSTRGRFRDGQLVGEGDRLQQGDQLVTPIAADRAEEQA